MYGPGKQVCGTMETFRADRCFEDRKLAEGLKIAALGGVLGRPLGYPMSSSEDVASRRRIWRRCDVIASTCWSSP